MQTFPDVAEQETTHELAVMVSMLDDHVVICPPSRPDVETIDIIISAAAAAVQSGSTVMIDLDPVTPSGDMIAGGFGDDHQAVDAREIRRVDVLGAGCVRLATEDTFWTIDFTNSRFCSTAAPVEPSSVTADRWMGIRAVWATCSTVSVLKSDGTYVSTRAAWTSTRHDDLRIELLNERRRAEHPT